VAKDAGSPAAAKTAETVPANERQEEERRKPSVAKPAPPEAKAVAAADTNRGVRLIEEAWQLRDSLVARSGPSRRTPIDFAPHLWRELEAILVHDEQLCLGGAAESSPPAAQSQPDGQPAEKTAGVAARWDDLEQIVAGLSELQAAINARRSPQLGPRNPERIENRLLAAWQRFLEARGASEATFDREENSFVVEVQASLRRFHDLAYAAPYYVRWHALASRMTSGELEQRREIGSFSTGCWPSSKGSAVSAE